MAGIAFQIVCKPIPGADMSVVMESLKDAADVWRKGGAEVKLYAVSAGEMGNLVFAALWSSATAYGKTLDKLTSNQSVQSLMARVTATGAIEWVRSNLAREIPI